MTTPKRIRRRRVKGYRMPAGARYVGRPGKWQSPFSIVLYDSQSLAALAFKEWMRGCRPPYSSPDRDREWIHDHIAELRGLDLACWCVLCAAHKDGLPLGVKCPDCEPCHADTLLEIANR